MAKANNRFKGAGSTWKDQSGRMNYAVVWILFFVCAGVIGMILKYLRLPAIAGMIPFVLIGFALIFSSIRRSRARARDKKKGGE